MTNFRKHIEKQIDKLEVSKADLEKKLMDNFEYGFKWYSEELFKSCYKLGQYNLILRALEVQDSNKNEEEKINGVVDFLTKQVINWSISRSTCPLTVQQSVYELEATKEILEDINWFF